MQERAQKVGKEPIETTRKWKKSTSSELILNCILLSKYSDLSDPKYDLKYTRIFFVFTKGKQNKAV